MKKFFSSFFSTSKRWLSGSAWLIYCATAGLVAFVIWATQTSIDELARARGQVVTVARTQIVQAPQDGLLADMLVREGESVNRGSVLARLDQTRVRAAYEDSQNKVAALKASLARLRAEVYSTPLSFPPELEAYSAFRENQTRLFSARKQSLEQGITALKSSRQLVRDEIRITEPLLRNGDVGQAEVIRLRRQEAELDGQIVNLRNKFFQDAQAEMTKAEEDLAAQEQLLEERSSNLRQTELRAPVDGVVRKIAVTTIGAAVRNGDVILEMLPAGSELIVEAKYPPANVASLAVGLPARIKLDAFDDSVYGAVDAVVTYISPDALMEPDGKGGENAFYRVRLRLEQPTATHASRQNDPMVINPGMTVTVEVRTRNRTVFSFLTKPITKTLSNSFTER
jgi:membrane fusion protein, adhesin transport system